MSAVRVEEDNCLPVNRHAVDATDASLGSSHRYLLFGLVWLEAER